MPEIPFQEASLKELLLLVGSLLYRGGELDNIDVELLMRLQELLDYEIEDRITGIPRGTQLH